MAEGRHFEHSGERFCFHDRGAYGDVYVNLGRTTCWKIFRDKGHNSESTLTFGSEVKAYELAAAHPELKRYVPYFYGMLDSPLKILDGSGQEVIDRYLNTLGYKMAFIDGVFQKVGLAKPSNHDAVVHHFREAGIHYLADASWTVGPRGEPRYIDFATEEHELFH